MWIPVLLFALGLLLLIKGGDWFVDGATSIARRFHISEILIGATVVSIGTTLPEVMVSAQAAIGGHGEMAYGNAIGSIICNTALIAAISVAVRPSKADRKTLILPVSFFFGSFALYAFTAYFFGDFSRYTGIALLLIFLVYMLISVKSALSEKDQEILGSDAAPTGDGIAETAAVSGAIWKDIAFLVVGAALIAFGANLLVDNGTIIAETVGVPESVIALTFVALGTSLPELVTAVTSLVKGHGSLSLGNIIGANLFNLVLVSGVATTLSPFAVPASKEVFGINSSLLIDIPLAAAVMALLVLPAIFRKKLSRWQGVTLLCIYAAFCTVQFVL